MTKNIRPDKALIFRITHRQNLPWVLGNGLVSANSDTLDPNFTPIGNPDLIQKRRGRQIPVEPYGTLEDYVPFYFTPFSPMLLNIKTGYNGIRKRTNEEIVIIVSSLFKVRDDGVSFVFSDRHAYLQAARFSNQLRDLDMIDWDILQRRDFRRDPNDLGKIERYQAEALIWQRMPVTSFLGVVCYDQATTQWVSSFEAVSTFNLKTISKPDWFF
jgi:hypothetical protein